MPFCKKKKDEHPSVPPFTVQKVVIPKGMINPNETTIIEIPARLHDQPLVIAKRKMNTSGWTSETIRRDPEEDYYDDMAVNRSRQIEKVRKTNPPLSHSYRIDDYTDFAPGASSSFKEVSNKILLQPYLFPIHLLFQEPMFYKSNRTQVYSAPSCKSPVSIRNQLEVSHSNAITIYLGELRKQ